MCGASLASGELIKVGVWEKKYYFFLVLRGGYCKLEMVGSSASVVVVKPLTIPSADVGISVTQNKRRARSVATLTTGSKKGGTGSIPVGRDNRPLVEDPVLTTSETRAAAKLKPLSLLLKVNSTYRSVAGSRRQSVSTDRVCVPLSCEQLISSAEALRSINPRSLPTTKTSKQSNNSSNGTAGGGSYPAVLRTQWMVLPEYLSEELWERHQYSLADVRKTLDAFPPRVLWQLVISYNRSATNASSRICADSDLHLTFGGKSTAIQKLIAMIKAVHPEWGSRPSVTWSMHKTDDPNGDHQVYDVSERHVPGLPVHRINRTTFDHLLNNMVYWPAATNRPSVTTTSNASAGESYYIMTTDSKSNNNNNQKNTSTEGGKVQISVTTKIAQSIFSWRDIHIVALEINKLGDLLLMGRVVPWSAYVLAHGVPESLRTCPNFVLAPDGYYALLDETFYFYAAPPDLNAPVKLPPTAAASALFKVPEPRPPRIPALKPVTAPTLKKPKN